MLGTELQLAIDNQILSPKEAQERVERQLKIVKIDKEIDSIVKSQTKQHLQCQQYMMKLNQIESLYLKENMELKQQIKNLSKHYQQLEQLYTITKDQLQRSLCSFQSLEIKYKLQQKQINRLRQLIKNQQNLFDQYRDNLQQEFVLQKQLMRSTFNEEKIKIEKQFSQTVIKLQNQYNDKLKRMMNKKRIIEFHEEVHQFKKYCNNYKQTVMKKSQSSYQKPNSQYSTNDRDVKHEQTLIIP